MFWPENCYQWDEIWCAIPTISNLKVRWFQDSEAIPPVNKNLDSQGHKRQDVVWGGVGQKIRLKQLSHFVNIRRQSCKYYNEITC